MASAAEREGLSVAVQPKANRAGGHWLPGFQAADLLAWEYRRGFVDIYMRAKSGKQLRDSFGALVTQIPHEGYELKKNQFMALCQERPDEFPPRELKAPTGQN